MTAASTRDLTFATGTPFAPRTEPLNRFATWLQWYGYLVADVYSSYEQELAAIRGGVAMNEMSPLQKYRVRGPDAARFLDHVVTRSLAGLAVGQIYYTPWCDEGGNVISEGLVFRLGPNDFRVSGGRSRIWFDQQRAAFDVEIEDETAELAILALQGPRSQAVLEQATGEAWGSLPFSRRRTTVVGGVQVDVSRQGFTGELGYELWVAAPDAVAMWDAIAEAGTDLGIRPAGEWAIDIARVEAGLLIPGYDYSMAGPDPGQDGIDVQCEYFATPFELGLGRFVDLDKPGFVGRRALIRKQHPATVLVGLDLDWRFVAGRYATAGLLPAADLRRVSWYPRPVKVDDQAGGWASSVTWSPTLRTMIGFGHIPTAAASRGARVAVVWSDPALGTEPISIPATIVELPFVRVRRA
jgi:aminomethyltransferase